MQLETQFFLLSPSCWCSKCLPSKITRFHAWRSWFFEIQWLLGQLVFSDRQNFSIKQTIETTNICNGDAHFLIFWIIFHAINLQSCIRKFNLHETKQIIRFHFSGVIFWYLSIALVISWRFAILNYHHWAHLHATITNKQIARATGRP